MDNTLPNSQTNTTANRVAEKAHQYVDRIAEQAAQAEEKLRSACDNATGRLSSSTDQIKARAGSMNSQVSNYIHEHPLTSLGVAFGAGLLLAAVLRR